MTGKFKRLKKNTKKVLKKTKKILRRGNKFGRDLNQNLKDYFEADRRNARSLARVTD